jgi:hypothetical protein
MEKKSIYKTEEAHANKASWESSQAEFHLSDIKEKVKDVRHIPAMYERDSVLLHEAVNAMRTYFLEVNQELQEVEHLHKMMFSKNNKAFDLIENTSKVLTGLLQAYKSFKFNVVMKYVTLPHVVGTNVLGNVKLFAFSQLFVTPKTFREFFAEAVKVLTPDGKEKIKVNSISMKGCFDKARCINDLKYYDATCKLFADRFSSGNVLSDLDIQTFNEYRIKVKELKQTILFFDILFLVERLGYVLLQKSIMIKESKEDWDSWKKSLEGKNQRKVGEYSPNLTYLDGNEEKYCSSTFIFKKSMFFVDLFEDLKDFKACFETNGKSPFNKEDTELVMKDVGLFVYELKKHFFCSEDNTFTTMQLLGQQIPSYFSSVAKLLKDKIGSSEEEVKNDL